MALILIEITGFLVYDDTFIMCHFDKTDDYSYIGVSGCKGIYEDSAKALMDAGCSVDIDAGFDFATPSK